VLPVERERWLQQAQAVQEKVERANRIKLNKNEFLAVLSHEL
jgi:signal transduction histidine kinase